MSGSAATIVEEVKKGRVKVYLDACCLNRLTDDQSQSRIAEEAEAVEKIFRLIREGMIEWLSSIVLKAETSNNPDAERKLNVEGLLSLATGIIPLDGYIIQRATELEDAGYGAFDALHLSSAEAGMADILLTTDDRFIRRAARNVGSPRVRVLNPIEWLREQ